MALYSEFGGAKPPQRQDEGAIRKVRARATLFMVLALGAGLGATWMVTRYVARHSIAAGTVETVKVVVAAVDMPLATTLRPELLKTIDWPTNGRPQGSFPDPKEVEGRVTGVALVVGEPVIEGRLTAKGRGAGMAALIPANMRAMTVHVNEVIGVGGFIHPGDLVDVLTTMQTPAVRPTTAGRDEYRSRIVLQNIRVLAIGEQLASEANKPESVPAVTLLVTPEQSERLALASTQGKLQLTMRSQADNEEIATAGISPPELLGPGLAVAASSSPAEPLPRHYSQRQDSRRLAALMPAAPPPPTPPPPKSGIEVVEIFRGDRLEQRTLPKKEAP